MEGQSTWPYLTDQNGDILNDAASQTDGQWHVRWMQFPASWVAQHIGDVKSTQTVNPTTSGPWDTYLRNIVIVSTNGSVHTLLGIGMQPSIVATYTPGVMTDVNAAMQAIPNAMNDPLATHYYVDDHLGTAQLELSGAGVPLWQGAFTPFGQEIIAGATTNYLGQQPQDGTAMRYKFTGKERDAESGLDYFGARYYGSNMGRFMSPDWSAKAEPVPYSKLGDPQTLNLYGYVGNNPLSRADADGHCWPICGLITTVSVYLGTHPNVSNALSKVGDHIGIRATVAVGRDVKVGDVKVKASVGIQAEMRADGTGSAGGQAALGASVGSIGIQARGVAPVEQNGELVNPITNANGSVSVNGKTALGSDANGTASLSTSGRIGVGPQVDAGVAQASVQVTTGTQDFLNVGREMVNSFVQETVQTIKDAKESLTCGSGGCAIPH